MTTFLGDVPLVIGLGCSTAAMSGEIIALVNASLVEAGREADDIAVLASHSRKRGSVALMEVAAHFGVPLRFLDDDELAAKAPGVCEAVAAAAGPLLQGKRKSRHATCAIAACPPDFELSRFGQPSSASALMASSTRVTSLAGP